MPTTPEQREMYSRILGSAAGRSLRKGARGKTVRALQLFLRDQGIEIKADGIFGPATQAALKQYQKSAGIGADGVAGSKTFKTISESITPMPTLRPRKPSPELSAMQAPAEAAESMPDAETPADMATEGPDPLIPPTGRTGLDIPGMAPPEPVALHPTGQAGGVVGPSVMGGPVNTVMDQPPMPPEQPPPGQGQIFGDSFPPEAARGFEAARGSLEAAGGNQNMDFMSGDYTSAHDQLVRALSGMQQPGPSGIGMANSPLAGTDQYMPGAPDMAMANQGNDPRLQELMNAMRGQGMTPSGENDPQRMALIKALLAR